MGRFSDLDVEARELLAEGLSVQEIANTLGVPLAWVVHLEDELDESDFVEYLDGESGDSHEHLR